MPPAQRHQAAVAADAVVLVDDRRAFGEFAEVADDRLGFAARAFPAARLRGALSASQRPGGIGGDQRGQGSSTGTSAAASPGARRRGISAAVPAAPGAVRCASSKRGWPSRRPRSGAEALKRSRNLAPATSSVGGNGRSMSWRRCSWRSVRLRPRVVRRGEDAVPERRRRVTRRRGKSNSVAAASKEQRHPRLGAPAGAEPPTLRSVGSARCGSRRVRSGHTRSALSVAFRRSPRPAPPRRAACAPGQADSAERARWFPGRSARIESISSVERVSTRMQLLPRPPGTRRGRPPRMA